MLILIVKLLYLYNSIISMFAFKKNKDFCFGVRKNKSFTVLIPAHNEEAVIYDNLKALYNTSYNKRLINVVVIADNCSDLTIKKCNQFRREHKDFKCTVLRLKGGTKPLAINKAIRFLKKKSLWTSDCIFMLDADNKVSKNIFNEYNILHEKHDILQCRILSQNEESFVSRGFSSSFNTMTYGFQKAKNNIGLSGSLSGTGFSISRKVFD